MQFYDKKAKTILLIYVYTVYVVVPKVFLDVFSGFWSFLYLVAVSIWEKRWLCGDGCCAAAAGTRKGEVRREKWLGPFRGRNLAELTGCGRL